MTTADGSSLSIPFPGSEHQTGTYPQVALYAQAMRTYEAIRLIELGARVGLVCQLTGLEKPVVNRLYRQLRGHSSPPGQTPFSAAWYQDNDSRLLQAAVVWRLYQRLTETMRSPAQVLIEVYENYTTLVAQPLLDFTRVAFVPRLLAMGIWQERRCADCQTSYLASLDDYRIRCPGCRLYYRHRCYRCGTVLTVHASGRRRDVCQRCKTAQRH